MARTSISTYASDDRASYEAVLDHLFVRTGAGVMLGLEPVAALLHELGDPHRAIPYFVVVAGTNGKGSTAAMIAAALDAAGHRVGLFTSPHLLRFTERIRIAGQEISKERVKELYARICAVEERCPRPPTYFECVTAMALCELAAAEVKVGVLEVGLGGRLDATNVVDKDLAVITPIALDHQHLLGETLDLIAAEKAAIIPPGKAAVIAPQPAAAQAVIERVAAEQRAELLPAAAVRRDAGHLVLVDGDATLELEGPPAAPYARSNLGVAWSACRRLRRAGIEVPDATFAAAARDFSWPGRYQWLRTPQGIDLVLDAAHNPAGIEALLAALAEDPKTRDPATGSPRPIHGVFSGLQDKPAKTHAALLRERLTELYLCPIPIRRGLAGLALAAVDPAAPVFDNVRAAIDAAEQGAAVDGGLVLVAGSVFLLSEVLGELTDAERDPPVAF